MIKEKIQDVSTSPSEHQDDLKRYQVTVKEVWHQTVKVKAKSPEEAKRLVSKGGIWMNSDLAYSHSLNIDDWEVEEI